MRNQTECERVVLVHEGQVVVNSTFAAGIADFDMEAWGSRLYSTNKQIFFSRGKGEAMPFPKKNCQTF